MEKCIQIAFLFFFSAPILIPLCVTVYAECIYVFYQNLVIVAECHVDC